MYIINWHFKASSTSIGLSSLPNISLSSKGLLAIKAKLYQQ